jgi:hypothetical protein
MSNTAATAAITPSPPITYEYRNPPPDRHAGSVWVSTAPVITSTRDTDIAEVLAQLKNAEDHTEIRDALTVLLWLAGREKDRTLESVIRVMLNLLDTAVIFPRT